MKKNIIHFLLIIVTICISSCSNETKDTINFSISYFKDLKQQETAKSILEKKLILLKGPNISFENGIYWFKVVLNTNSIEEAIVFDLLESNIDNITIYQNSKIVPFEELDNTHFSLLVNSKSNSSPFFLKVNFKKEVYFPLQVKSYKKSQLNEKYIYLKNGIYYGFALMVLIVNIFFYYSLKDKTFLYYSFFLIAITIAFLGYDGLLYTILPPNSWTYSGVLTHYLITFFGFIFGIKFLNIKYYLAKANSLGICLLLIATFSYLLFIPTHKFIFVALADTVSFFVLLHNWIIGIIIFRKHDFAKFFVIGYSLLLFSAAFFIIPIDWGLEIYTTSLSHIKFGAIFEMLILTYAITYRVNILQKENKKFKVEIKEYLDRIILLKDTGSNNNKTNIDVLIAQHNVSNRESDVLHLIFKGYTNQRIADELFISLNTVKYHIRNIYQKLNIKSKNEAIDLFSEIKNTTV